MNNRTSANGTMRSPLRTFILVIAIRLWLIVANDDEEEVKKWVRKIKIINESSSTVDIFWIGVSDGEAHAMAEGVTHGTTQPFNSFIGHTFEVRESPDPTTGLCSAGGFDDLSCRANRFTVSEDDVDLQSKSLSVSSNHYNELEPNDFIHPLKIPKKESIL